jgi:branched-chain amino acid transport system substrate-binding protein
VELVTGVITPVDAKGFLAQARRQGFRPKAITLAKALLFPATVEALGDAGDGLSTEVWWSPTMPYRSSLTGQTAAQLAAGYEAGSRQWIQPLGFVHALFELAIDALKRAKDAGREALRDAISATDAKTVVGPVKFGVAGAPRNVAKTPLALGQWGKGTKHKYELSIVEKLRPL